MQETHIPNHSEWSDDRIENPAETVLKRDGRVKIKIGPAIGKMGTVVVERRANYKSWSKSIGDESIGVKVDGERTIRWFDDAEQLEVLG